MSIPVISPVEIVFPRELAARLLGAGEAAEPPEPDYTIHALSEPATLPDTDTTEPALAALDDIERTTAVSEYHDFEWWRSRIETIRAALQQRL